MTKRLLLSLLALAVLCSTGCVFSRKSRKPKETSALASATEQEFHQRWITRRVNELAAQGITGSAAQEQAEREFQEKYNFALPAKK